MTAAMTLFAQQGFHGAPMARIADMAEVGMGTIYRYFVNRDRLILDIYMDTYADLRSFLIKEYPLTRSMPERFFHLFNRLVTFFVDEPLSCTYLVQFHNSPYGLAYRKAGTHAIRSEFDFISALFNEGRECLILKDLPMEIFFIMTFGPIFSALKDHHDGLITLDVPMVETLVKSCWDSVRR